MWYIYTRECCCCLVTKCCPTFVTPWTVAHQAPLSILFSRQEYWSELPFPSPGDLPEPGIKTMSPALALVCAKLLQSCLTLFNSMTCSLPCSSVHGTVQEWIWQGVAMPSSRRYSQPRDRIASLLSPALTGRFFITEPPGTPTRGCYLAIKKNEIMPFAETQMNLETVTVNGVSHKKTDIMIPLITGITK